jgi:hypothetical protein
VLVRRPNQSTIEKQLILHPFNAKTHTATPMGYGLSSQMNQNRGHQSGQYQIHLLSVQDFKMGRL